MVRVKVGMGDLNVISGSGTIQTTGLGSCVGVVIYDPGARVAGMAHIMLPSSEIARGSRFQVAKYADTAIPEVVHRMNDRGAQTKRMYAKLIGGAQMFTFPGSEGMRIGSRNVESCKRMLEQLSIPIQAEDTGGNYGRTIELDCRTGVLLVRSMQYGVKEL